MNIHKHKSQSNNKTNNNNQLTPELNHHLIPSRNSRSLAQALPTKNKRWNSSSQKPAFTIIEVVLVLAIAGLIFLMVFIALPALQRNQRDTQRKNDIGRVLTALQSYQSNNRGSIPTSWASQLITPYLRLDGDTFTDPSGINYNLWPRTVADGKPTQRINGAGDNSIIFYYLNSKCDGENIVAADGANKVAFAALLEGGGIYCVNN
ncbi:type II secretion system protein [Candidatus Saccharibacteria bacterium]|nr:type II secretion system protein [Candidatus Saccharibacteria bacterium]